MTTPSMTSTEAYHADIVEMPARFAASLFLGRGKYANAEAATREEIDAEVAKMIAANPRLTFKPVITAFDAAGNSTIVNAKPYKAAKAKKPAKAKKEPVAKAQKAKPAKKAAKAPTPAAKKPAGGKRADILAAAEAGTIPAAPDFSAPTHKRFLKKHAELVALVESGNIKALKAYEIKPISSSPKALAKYRDLAVIALAAKAKGA